MLSCEARSNEGLIAFHHHAMDFTMVVIESFSDCSVCGEGESEMECMSGNKL